MPKRITLIPGDGIGPEVTGAATQLLEAAGADLVWEEVEAGERAISTYGKPLPDEVLESILDSARALLDLSDVARRGHSVQGAAFFEGGRPWTLLA